MKGEYFYPLDAQYRSDEHKPLFTLTLPTPKYLIGTQPTMVYFKKTGSTEKKTVASSVTFFYENVNLSQVKVFTENCHREVFSPIFADDDSLPAAFLGIHLTRIMNKDRDHRHSKKAFKKMLAMYSGTSVTSIEYPPPRRALSPELEGSGDNCKVPQMLVTVTG